MTDLTTESQRFAPRDIADFAARVDKAGTGATPRNVTNLLKSAGIARSDPRFASLIKTLDEWPSETISVADLAHAALGHSQLLGRLARRELSIPNFAAFCSEIAALYDEVKSLDDGAPAAYIPELARADASKFGVAICTVDGQQFAIGDSADRFTIQSISKPITYGAALELYGLEKVHAHVGREASGHGFNAITLNDKNLPHNPMINAGAIACCGLIEPHRPLSDRFRIIEQTWRSLAGGGEVGFDPAVYASERETGDRNYALAYFMRENGVFPEDTDVREVLDLYFQICSLQLNAESLAVAAGTLAKGGFCPITDDRVFSNRTIKNILSLMFVNGMYDFSGEFAFQVGLPAKSGVSGAIMIVVPKTLGLVVWSPPIDTRGNSVRGLEFARLLINRFNFHLFDAVDDFSMKLDPRKKGL